jgi:hypothetical protein
VSTCSVNDLELKILQHCNPTTFPTKCIKNWHIHKLLDRLKCEYKMKTTIESRVGARSLAHSTLGGGGSCWSSRMGLGIMTSTYSLTWTCTKPNNKLVSALLEPFGVKTSHRQTQIHKTHHGPNLGEATTFPLIVYFVPLHEAHIQMTFWESRNCQSWDSRNFGVP